MAWMKHIATGVICTFFALGGAVVMSSGTGCSPGMIDAANVQVAGFDADQLANAAVIANAAVGAGLPRQAHLIGIATAMGESGLRNLNYGDKIHGVTNPDGSATTSLGLFQQQEWWGSVAERLDPATASARFMAQLAEIPSWQTISPSAAAHAVQRNTDPDFYTQFVAPAAQLLGSLETTGGGSGCGIGDDAQTLAGELVSHLDDGTLISLEAPPEQQIRWVAEGSVVPDCSIDIRTLQIMVIAVRNFDRVGISSVNRKCTRDLIGGGEQGPHYRDGGGGAVDFYSLNGTVLTGADHQSLRLIGLLDPLVPDGARIGQSNCRADLGVRLALEHFGEFSDACHHLHVDVARTGGQLVFD